MSEWISVKDRLPEEEEEVLVSDGKYISNGLYDLFIKEWASFDYRIDNVTHWMPLPEPPKEDV